MTCTKTTLKRAGRTFIQSALAYITVNVMYINFTDDKVSVKSAVTGLLIAAVSAGISAVMNLEKKEGEC
ncbi:hypothetical protein [Eubacterium coprostanoligenes]|uniref:Uncharacterized protein n=1 Tax=Eubacterium coprostanoligenes TaxID=290054 RepID=A0A1T4KAL2_9FIRM|nr:hypothetical protein [Eubacterium coprostanoligenes]MCI6254260.1 hypothetical protein [Eubacterium coprostanoligenes]MCI6354961.1 hypothetical protein [Eubacterium coprostanoligenes]MCI6360429.1 hypothetical protein [Eubacterium coprostanoligenes]MCI7265258.1 hypothetical protein [Eubacterium coprostanoligenes]MDD6666260.1 hypothetical protein [Eubacterium coprostanoligenes]